MGIEGKEEPPVQEGRRGRRQRRWHRRVATRPWLRLLGLATLLVLAAGCTAAGAGARPAADGVPPAASPGGRDAAPGAGQAAGEVQGVELAPDRARYRPGEPMRLEFRNGTGDVVQLTGGLGGLRGWRLEGNRREPWDHGMMESTALVPVPPGQAVPLGPVPAPDRPGQYLLEVRFYHAGGSGAARATIEVAPGG